jgi:D-alanine-D-alanine ligase
MTVPSDMARAEDTPVGATRSVAPTAAQSVLVLYNKSDFVTQGEAQDLVAVQGVIACAHAVSEALTAAGYRVVEVPVTTTAEEALAPYPAGKWVVFNLCEGLNNRLFDEARSAWAIEAMGYRYTGNNGEALARSTNKAQAKAYLARAGVPTPAWRLYRSPGEVQDEELAFPMFVKPVAEDASQGIGEDSVVRDLEALRRRVGYIAERYRQGALAEAFVAGREFNVALWGQEPEVLPLAEIDFSAFPDPLARIVTFAAKWEEESFEYVNTPVHCPAPMDEATAERLRDVARSAWAAIGCRGYARVDIRMDEAGTPYVVEVNCNPDISPDAGFFRAARAAGYSFQKMAEKILLLAW